MSFPRFSLDGKVALVTGASKGIGRFLALALADAGADVIVTARTESQLEEVRDEIRRMGRRSEYIAADISDVRQAIEMAKEAIKVFGKVDILVNNAGVSFPQPAFEVDEKSWDMTFAVNLKAMFFISQVIARESMVKIGGGKIINVSSQAGVVALKDHAAYCASKAGVILLTKVLAVEWAPYNINVNAIAPTVIMTPMAERAWADPQKRADMLRSIPLGRFGRPEDVAGAVIFLASPASDLITGEVIMIDGGYTSV